MSRIQQALQQLKPNTRLPLSAIEQYIRTGDGKLIASLKPVKQTGYSWEGTVLAGALAPFAEWTEEDRRLLHVVHALGLMESLGDWLDSALGREQPHDDVIAAVRKELEPRGATTEEIANTLTRVRAFVRNGKPSAAGRLLLALSDEELRHAVKQTYFNNVNLDLVRFLLDFVVDRMAAVLPELLQDRGHSGNASAVAALMLQRAGTRFEKEVFAFFQSMKDPWHRFHVGQALFEYDAGKYGDVALDAARASLAGPTNSNNHGPVGDWMLKHFGMRVLDDMTAYLGNPKQGHYYWRNEILSATVATLGRDALPAIQATLQCRNDPKLQLDAVGHLIAFKDSGHDLLIQAELEKILQGGPDERPAWRRTDTYEQVVRAIGLIGRWNPQPFVDRLWELLNHKSKPVREAAARALGQHGDAAIAPAAQLLRDGKADARVAAVIVLTVANTPEALKVLEKRLDQEPDDDVRDAILLGLETAWAASGRKVTRKDVDARIGRAADKLKKLPATWINETKAPALKFKDGKPLSREAIRYLLYRQSRAREIRPDIEAKALYGMIDRASSGEFAAFLLNGFLGSKAEAGDRWALTVAALLGDDRVVPILNQQIRQWGDSSRGKMAEYAVQALSLLGSDTALLTLDSLAIRYRTKNKNVGRAAVEAFSAAAENLGITVEELGDRVVPWLGFEPGKPRMIDCAGRKIEAHIGLDLKLRFRDVEKNKPVASLPKTAAKEILAECKELSATLREVVKAQTLRLENLMVRQQRWQIDRWQALFPVHPLLLPLAVRLVWGVYDDAGACQATFRTLEDRTFTQASDEPYELPARGKIGIVHPLELSEEQRKAWQAHLVDYEITPPLPQLERPVVLLTPDRVDQKTLTDQRGTTINGMTFKGRAERLGWSRGSVADAGGITSYVKSFPAAGVDVILGLDGMYIGMDMYTEIKLQDGFFVKSGSVKTGSYMYDEPSNERDPRVLRFGDVPAIVYSEVLGDLQKIAGKAAAEVD